MKERMRPEDLFKDLPSMNFFSLNYLEEFCLAFEYIKQLDFEEKPNYKLIERYLNRVINPPQNFHLNMGL
jgi:hypothetical protein